MTAWGACLAQIALAVVWWLVLCVAVTCKVAGSASYRVARATERLLDRITELGNELERIERC